MKTALALMAAAMGASAAYAQTMDLKFVNSRSDEVYIQPNRDDYLLGRKNGAYVAVKSQDASHKLSDYDKDSSGAYLFRTGKVAGAKIFFSIGSALPTSSPEHNWRDANMANVRYDSLEMTFDATPTGSINSTSIEQLGICFNIESHHAGKNAPVVSACWTKSFNEIFIAAKSALGNDQDKFDSVAKSDSNGYFRLIGPHSWNNYVNNPQASTPWDDGIALALQKADGKTFTIKDRYIPSLNMTGSYKYDKTTKLGSITLKGSVPGSANATMEVKNISVPAIVFAKALDANDVLCNGQPHSPGSNDGWEAAYNRLVTGFNAGYWCNDDADSLNSKNWAGADGQGSAKPFSNAAQAYSHYSALIRSGGASYGDPYSDNEGGKSLVYLNPSEVDSVTITILGDSSAKAGENKKGTDI